MENHSIVSVISVNLQISDNNWGRKLMAWGVTKDLLIRRDPVTLCLSLSRIYYGKLHDRLATICWCGKRMKLFEFPTA